MSNSRAGGTEPARILIVDDEPEVLDTMKEMVAHMGYEVDTASGGREALARAGEFYYDLVITDIQMPELDGLELIRRLKESHPEVDVIAVTGFKEYRYTDIVRQGASDFIAKPVDVDELHAKILRIFKERQVWSVFQRMTDRDRLTDLYNRRYFDLRGVDEVARSLRQDSPLSLILMAPSSASGDPLSNGERDRLLPMLAEIVLSSIRTDVDMGFRYASDILGILAPDAESGEASGIGERVRARFAAAVENRIPVVIGVSSLKDSGLGPDRDFRNLVQRAEEALNEARSHTGRLTAQDAQLTSPNAK